MVDYLYKLPEKLINNKNNKNNMTNIKLSKPSVSLVFGAGMVIASAFVIFGSPVFANADTLYRQLEVGSTGSDVASLQSFLAQDRTMYPSGLVTSYFGSLTKTAVSNFQTRNGIASVGRVGPVTLPVLNAQMRLGINNSADSLSPQIYNLNVSTQSNKANVMWNTNELAFGLVYYSTSPLITSEHFNSVDVSGQSAITIIAPLQSQNVSLTGLQSNTTYYYLVYSTDKTGNVSVSWPSTFHTNY